MIIEGLLNIIKTILTFILGILPNIPNLPASLLNSITSLFDLFFSNAGLLGLFIRIDTIKIIVPIVLLIINFDYIYKFAMWLIKKIPMLGIN